MKLLPFCQKMFCSDFQEELVSLPANLPVKNNITLKHAVSNVQKKAVDEAQNVSRKKPLEGSSVGTHPSLPPPQERPASFPWCTYCGVLYLSPAVTSYNSFQCFSSFNEPSNTYLFFVLDLFCCCFLRMSWISCDVDSSSSSSLSSSSEVPLSAVPPRSSTSRSSIFCLFLAGSQWFLLS